MGRACAFLSAGIFVLAAPAVISAADSAAPTVAQPASLSSSTRLAIRDREQTAYINEQIRQGWQAHNVRPAPAATDGEWCRRVYLDVLGRIPSVDEVERHLADRSSDKKRNLVNRLLSDEYVEEYARNWSNLWTSILIGRPPANNERTLADREGMQKFLRDSFARNKPYDRMVYELVTATGVNKPGEEGFRGEVNFLLGNADPDRPNKNINATAKTAKVFLGLQVQCTQCHNHPFNDWKQNQFWELNAFFRQAVNDAPQRKTREPTVELADKDFSGEGGPGRGPKNPRNQNNQSSQNVDQAVVFYDLRNGQVKAAFPVFVDGQEISQSGRLSVVNRREELAKFITDSSYMNEAIVNRMWGHFLGYGFTKPVDDMGPHNPPSHPELLKKLADDFASHSHDLKQLIRWIVLSEPYGLSSKMPKRGDSAKDKEKYIDDPSKGDQPMFSHFYMRQMRPEELYESLLVATEVDKTVRESEKQEQMKTQWLRQFTIAFGTDDGEDTTTFNGTIPQTLVMFNGDLIRRATNADKGGNAEGGGFLDRIASDPKLTNPTRINHLFMATLARKPTREEIEWANKLLLARNGKPVEALADIFWVTLNTGEFILNH